MDFLSCEDEKILEKADMRNGKFDCVLMNPPYSGERLGDGLYVKFLNKCLKITKKLISINPDTAIIGHLTGSTAKIDFKEIRKNIDTYFIDIEYSKNAFDAAIKGNLCIIYIDKEKNHKIIFTKNNITKEFDLQKNITSYFDNEYLENFDKHIRKFMENSPSFESHLKLTKGYGDFSKSKLKENNPNKNALYIYLIKPNASFPYIGYKNRNGFDKVKEYNEEDQKISCGYINFDKSELQKANNALKYINSKFVNLCVKFACISNIGNVNRYQIIPWLDFSKSYSEEELFAMIGMKYDEKEINKILSQF